MRELLIIAGCGAVGAVGRFLLSGWVYQWLGTAFPYGTLAVNLVGCFLIGLLAHVGVATDLLSPTTRNALGVGLLGAFTTYSTFGIETFYCLEDGQWLAGIGNIAANVALGLLAVWGGLTLARVVFGGT